MLPVVTAFFPAASGNLSLEIPDKTEGFLHQPDRFRPADRIPLQLTLLLCGALLYAGMTHLSCRKACADFEKLDL